MFVPGLQGVGASGLASSLGGKVVQGIGAAGSVLGSMGKTAAANRGSALEAQQNQDRINIARAVEDRASRGDAWKKLLNAQYVLGGGSQFKAPAGLPSYGFGPHAPTADTMAGARGLSAEVMNRLVNGSTLPPGADMSLTKPGAFEQFTNVAAPAASVFGQLAKMKQPVPVVGGSLPNADDM